MKTKTYVITGATSGIGKALVEVLSKENIVFAGYRSEQKGTELAKFSKNIYPFYVDYANIYFFFNIRQINYFDIIIDFADDELE